MTRDEHGVSLPLAEAVGRDTQTIRGTLRQSVPTGSCQRALLLLGADASTCGGSFCVE